ncbi:MAG: hypothetical protein IPF92_05380 [Myxococcales bacterium]|nr:hypothetical protein [Myxococcales bacterium]MBL0198000.1 hypothetical protein [Myxococcales bacterium]HQY60745.1 hypothetical protein [Polyangiaceae bacterium]
MHPLSADLFLRALSPTDAATPLRVQARVHEAFPGRVYVATRGLALEAFAEAGRCELELLASPPPFAPARWGGPSDDRVVRRVEQGCFRVVWEGEEIFVVRASWPQAGGLEPCEWLVGLTEPPLLAFLLAVTRATPR